MNVNATKIQLKPNTCNCQKLNSGCELFEKRGRCIELVECQSAIHNESLQVGGVKEKNIDKKRKRLEKLKLRFPESESETLLTKRRK